MTRAELRTYVLSRLGVDSSDTARVTSINFLLDQHYLRLCARYRLKTTTSTLGYVADTATISLPSDCVEILAIRASTTVLQPIDFQTHAEYLAADLAGDPAYYLLQDASTIRVFPVPAETDAAAATLYYVARPTTLATGGDSASPSTVPTDFHDLIAERVLQQIWLDEEEPGQAAAAAQVADRLEAELARIARSRQGMSARRIVSPVYG